MTSADARLSIGISNLLQEYVRSVSIHTDWREYEASAVYEAVEDEFLEFRRAVVTNTLDGAHSICVESLQLAVVALKAHIYHSTRPQPQPARTAPIPFYSYGNAA